MLGLLSYMVRQARVRPDMPMIPMPTSTASPEGIGGMDTQVRKLFYWMTTMAICLTVSYFAYWIDTLIKSQSKEDMCSLNGTLLL